MITIVFDVFNNIYNDGFFPNEVEYNHICDCIAVVAKSLSKSLAREQRLQRRREKERENILFCFHLHKWFDSLINYPVRIGCFT